MSRRGSPQTPQHGRAVRALAAPAALAALAVWAPAPAPARAAPPAPAPAGEALLEGSFQMSGRVTVARRVPGEQAGELFSRVWTFEGLACEAAGCSTVRLQREREGGVVEPVTLHRVAAGRYVGRGAFRAPITCRGRVYPRGSYVPYLVSLEITAAQLAGGVAHASAVEARYVNRFRTDSTRCPLGPSHDQAIYTGVALSAP